MDNQLESGLVDKNDEDHEINTNQFNTHDSNEEFGDDNHHHDNTEQINIINTEILEQSCDAQTNN
jgi:hypothetical protein